METLAVYNIKGGVGKTTTAVNLAYLSAADGWRTLLWDLDPQGAATYIFGAEPRTKGSAKRLVRGKQEPDALAVPTRYDRLELLPADFSYRRFDVHLHARKNPVARLGKVTVPLHRRYGCLFLDCAPGITLTSENVMHAATALVVPLLPSPLSVRTLEQLLNFIGHMDWSDLVVLPFFSMVDSRRALHRGVTRDIRRDFPMILETEIPYASDVEKMTLRRAPLPAYAPKSAAAQLYASLWSEIDDCLEEASRARLLRHRAD